MSQIPNPGSASASAPFSSASSPMLPAGARRQAQQRRIALVMWLRNMHGWIGLWGAILGLIFGIAGIWLNHRAVLKLPLAQQRINAQLALPEPPPASAQEMAAWLQKELGQASGPNSMRTEPSRPVAWTDKSSRGGRGERGGHAAEPSAAADSPAAAAPTPAPAASPPAPLMQPERWVFNFGGPDAIVQAEYWRGNRSVGVTTTQNGFVATLTNLHKGVGMPVAWILLVDTLAGSMIFLSISGVLLWMLTHRRRQVGLAIFGTSLAVTLGLALSQI